MRYIDCNKQEFDELIENKVLVCIGAGPMLQQAVLGLDILDDIAYLIDNDVDKHGKEITLLNRKMTVNDINILQDMNADNVVILITTRFYESIRRQLETYFKDKDFCVAVYVWIEHYLDKNKSFPDFMDARIVEPSLMVYEEYLEHCDIDKEEIRHIINKKREQIKADIQEGKLIVPQIGVRRKSSCTLQCDGCSMLMPQIKNHYYIKAEQVIRDLELFFENVDECMTVSLSDGETFLDPELGVTLEWLIQNPKVRSISLNTNGTMLPRSEWIPYLKNEKVFIRISDYGYLSSMAKLIELFEENEIQFSVLSEMEWFDVKDTTKKNRTKKELKYDYLRCMNSLICKALAGGYLYLCDRCFRMERLNIPYYNAENDKICLADYSKEERKQVIWDMYLRESAEACDFCDLGSMEVKTIEAGKQLNGSKRKKSGYTIVKRK